MSSLTSNYWQYMKAYGEVKSGNTVAIEDYLKNPNYETTKEPADYLEEESAIAVTLGVIHAVESTPPIGAAELENKIEDLMFGESE